jgi:hypothetical protein
MNTNVFEFYSDLDSLGRCGQEYANICGESWQKLTEYFEIICQEFLKMSQNK